MNTNVYHTLNYLFVLHKTNLKTINFPFTSKLFYKIHPPKKCTTVSVDCKNIFGLLKAAVKLKQTNHLESVQSQQSSIIHQY